MLRSYLKLLGHVGDDVGLADGLPARDRQRVVGVGAFGELRRHEVFARHLVHSAQHRLVADPAPAQRKLKLHAFHVGCFESAHDDLASGVACFTTLRRILALVPRLRRVRLFASGKT